MASGESAVGLVEYGQRGDGAHNVGVDLEHLGVRVLVQPSGADENKAARLVAERICDGEEHVSRLQAEADALRLDNRALWGRVAALRTELRTAQTINEAAIAGRRRFFGAVLMTPVTPGDWTGEVWLLDPAKRERGYGLRFNSLAEVRALHPELWVVRVEPDGAILLDAWATKVSP
jgi:hypothetical protein